MLLVININSLRGGHTYTHKHTHTYRLLYRNNFKKPGMHRPSQHVPGLKIFKLLS